MQIGKGLEHKVQWLLERRHGTLEERLGLEYLMLERECVKATMPVSAGNKQPFGILHGGASVALAETLASVGGWLNVDHEKHQVVGVEINANHLRAMREGNVVGTATPLHIGRSTQVWEIKITGEDGNLCCVSRCTLAVIGK